MIDDDREAAERVRRLFAPIPYRPGPIEALAVVTMTALSYQFFSTIPDVGLPAVLLVSWLVGQGSVEIAKGIWRLILRVSGGPVHPD